MYIFDSHVHIYPEKIADKASDTIGKFYDLKMSFNGSISMLLSECEKAGVNRCLVHSVATTREQVQKINDFISASVKEYPDKFVGFGSLHPSMNADEVDAEVTRMTEIGLMGIKLHPDFQYFAIDDKHAMEMYEVVDGRLPILFHTGDNRYNYSNPQRLAAAAKRFPGQKMIGAHFGGYTEVETALRCLPDLPNVWVDSSSSLAFLTVEKAKECVRAYTEDRIFFGTDYPMWSATDELRRIDRLELTETAREKIFYRNICEFLGITV